MRYLLPVLLALVVAASAIGAPDRLAAQTPPPGSYLETFDQFETSAPLAVGPSAAVHVSGLDIIVHSRDITTWGLLEGMSPEHGPGCEAPPATHAWGGPSGTASAPYAEAAFICNDHLMTALNADGYGVIYLTPAVLADFSGGEAVIRLDVSMLRHSNRDWWDVWVTPFDDQMLAPLSPFWPDLSGLPKRGLNVTMGNYNNGSNFRAIRIDEHVSTDISSCPWCTYESVLTPSATRRDTFELRVSRTGLRFALLNGATGQPLQTWANATFADLGWDKGVVQIGHHSYNPEKDGGMPGTWHWDNISVSPTAPLTVIPANERRTNATQPVYTFAQPAPSDAYLLVHALATDMEYSLDAGATWATLGKQASVTHKWQGRRTYRQAIPAGTTAVMLRGVEESGPWDANHAAVYSLVDQQQLPPTPDAPTPTPLPTEPPPPTFTPGPTSTPEPLPTSTSTPESPTPVPPTATPPPPPQTGALDCVRIRYETGHHPRPEAC